uniref:Uncharacterized protein n=1 Tax=Romanomermis culicivorax TaxID=13658 RepID=A0A915KI19_ROMCU
MNCSLAALTMQSSSWNRVSLINSSRTDVKISPNQFLPRHCDLYQRLGSSMPIPMPQVGSIGLVSTNVVPSVLTASHRLWSNPTTLRPKFFIDFGSDVSIMSSIDCLSSKSSEIGGGKFKDSRDDDNLSLFKKCTNIGRRSTPRTASAKRFRSRSTIFFPRTIIVVVWSTSVVVVGRSIVVVVVTFRHFSSTRFVAAISIIVVVSVSIGEMRIVRQN